MGKLYLLIGKTNAGKDTVFKNVLKMTNLKPVVPYTTRQKRPGEIDDVDYHFVDNHFFNACLRSDEILEYRSYNTTKGRVFYFETKESIDLTSEIDYILVCTAEAAQSIKDKLGNDNVIVIYLYADDFLRLKRYVNRESLSSNPDALEICRRFLHESEEYEDERLDKLGVDLKLENDNLENCVKQFLDFYKSIHSEHEENF